MDLGSGDVAPRNANFDDTKPGHFAPSQELDVENKAVDRERLTDCVCNAAFEELETALSVEHWSRGESSNELPKSPGQKAAMQRSAEARVGTLKPGSSGQIVAEIQCGPEGVDGLKGYGTVRIAEQDAAPPGMSHSASHGCPRATSVVVGENTQLERACQRVGCGSSAVARVIVDDQYLERVGRVSRVGRQPG